MMIKEMRQHKESAEKVIGDVLDRFATKTGLQITGVEFLLVDARALGDERARCLYGVRIEVKL